MRKSILCKRIEPRVEKKLRGGFHDGSNLHKYNPKRKGKDDL